MCMNQRNQSIVFLREDSNNNSSGSLHDVSANSSSQGHRNQKTVKGLFTSHLPLQVHVKNLGDVSIPVSQKTAYDILLSTRKSNILMPDDVSLSFGPRGSPSFIRKLLSKMLDVNPNHLLNMDIEARLQKMVLFHQGNEKNNLLLANEQVPEGSFGSFIIQLPIKGGYTGGLITTTTTEGVEQHFGFSSRSTRHYCILSFLEPVNVEMQPIERGMFIGLVLNLIWPDYCTLKNWQPSMFPDLVRNAALIDENFKFWHPTPPNDVFLVERLQLQKTVDPNDQETNEVSSIYCYLLEETCCSLFKCKYLDGSDNLLLAALKLIDYIDVHLVVMQSKKEEGKAERTWEVVTWMESAAGTPIPKRKASVNEQQIGNLSNYTCLIEREETLLFPAIAVQRRSASIRSKCHEQFDELLDCLSQRVPFALQRPFECKKLFSDLKHCLDFCRENARTVWSSDSRLSKLFDLCIQLKANKEGLQLLDIITRTFASIENAGDRFVEGIRSMEVAKKIALFIDQISDWDQCGLLILRAIHGITVITQLKNICFLANELLQRRNRKAADEIAFKIGAIFETLLHKDVLAKVAEHELIEYLNLCAACCNYVNAQKLLLKLDADKLSRVLFDWELSFAGNYDTGKFYNYLCNFVILDKLRNSEVSSGTCLNLANFHQNMRNGTTGQSFSRVNVKYVTSYPQFEKLILTHANFEMRTSILRGFQGREEVVCFIDQLLIYLKSEVVEDEAFQARLLACFHFVCIGPENERHLSVLAKIFEKLRVCTLCFLIFEAADLMSYKLVPQSLSERVCQAILGRSISVLLSESAGTLMQVTDLMKTDRKLLSSFCSKLCSEQLTSLMDIIQRNRLILRILTGSTDAVPVRMLIFALFDGFYCLLSGLILNELSAQIGELHKMWPQIELYNEDLDRQFREIVYWFNVFRATRAS